MEYAAVAAQAASSKRGQVGRTEQADRTVSDRKYSIKPDGNMSEVPETDAKGTLLSTSNDRPFVRQSATVDSRTPVDVAPISVDTLSKPNDKQATKGQQLTPDVSEQKKPENIVENHIDKEY